MLFLVSTNKCVAFLLDVILEVTYHISFVALKTIYVHYSIRLYKVKKPQNDCGIFCVPFLHKMDME